MEENYFETFLNIKTDGEQALSEVTEHYNRYEPTDYNSLEKFFFEFPLTKTDSLVDFGCGLGRLNFYLNNKFNIKTTGIEMNTLFYNAALKNKISYFDKFKDNNKDLNFLNLLAEEYDILNDDNKFYFFNPFSVQIFMKVIENILTSYLKAKRDIHLILFYPSTDYIFFLENCNLFSLIKEVKLENFKKDPNERFLVYKLISF